MDKNKRKGGAEKARLKKQKSLQEEAAKCSKITDLFGVGVGRRAAAVANDGAGASEGASDMALAGA